MRRWYSPRGLRRGLLLAGIASALWLCWVAGYLQATVHRRLPPASTTTTTPVDAPCCLPPQGV
jgi:hypothetical protein